MTSNEILDAEYRQLIRELHAATIETVVAVERFWTVELFRAVSLDSAPEPDPQSKWQTHLQTVVEPRLYTLAYGHPDPDVRQAADILAKRLFGAVFYLDPQRAKRNDGREVTAAIQMVHRAIVRLTKAAYHAPFRPTRPTPDFTGVLMGNLDPLPSAVLDKDPEEVDRKSYGY